MSKEDQIAELKALLNPAEIIHPGDPSYEAESKTFSTAKNLHPQIVIRPNTVESLSKAVKFLAQSSLDFQVRNTGCGSASARDVLISTRAFTDFEFDRENEVVYLGAGCLWSEYYQKMEETAPEYTVVACRTPFIGVGGSVLASGYSWLSGDYGCTSDPDNMLDAQVVKLDGSVIWASQEPELLWGLRGAYVGLGVVTKFKLRARKYPEKIWGGLILIPMNKQSEVAKGIEQLDVGYNHPKVAMFLYALHGPSAEWFGAKGETLVVHAFDGNGEEHGRKMFDWALSIEGAIDSTKVTNLRGMSELQAGAAAMHGIWQTWWSPLAVPRMNERVISNAFSWWSSLHNAGGSIKDAGFLIFELFSTRASASEMTATAWPRPQDYRHMVLLGTGCNPDAPKEEVDLARKLIQDGAKEILGDDYNEGYIAPNGLEDFHNVKEVYGVNYDKIVALKRKYDPENRFQGPVSWL